MPLQRSPLADRGSNHWLCPSLLEGWEINDPQYPPVMVHVNGFHVFSWVFFHILPHKICCQKAFRYFYHVPSFQRSSRFQSSRAEHGNLLDKSTCLMIPDKLQFFFILDLLLHFGLIESSRSPVATNICPPFLVIKSIQIPIFPPIFWSNPGL